MPILRQQTPGGTGPRGQGSQVLSDLTSPNFHPRLCQPGVIICRPQDFVRILTKDSTYNHYHQNNLCHSLD